MTYPFVFKIIAEKLFIKENLIRPPEKKSFENITNKAIAEVACYEHATNGLSSDDIIDRVSASEYCKGRFSA